MAYPTYSYPPSVVLGLADRVFFGGRRSFRRDGQACLRRLDPPLRLLGRENLPACGPALITFNHYYRPGFSAWWMALAIDAVMPEEVHFVMTGELTYPGKWYAPLGMAVSRWLLQRLGRVYGFTTMPPMPPRPRDVAARTRAVRSALAYARSHPAALLGLAPEGGDQPGGRVNWPPSGAGRFVALLAEGRRPILPVGAYEEDGAFCLNVGEAYRLELPAGLSSEGRDRSAARLVMKMIAALLPARLRGEFG
jgi:hypothetical protein